jgi:predicted component of type VI protein secretion system
VRILLTYLIIFIGFSLNGCTSMSAEKDIDYPYQPKGIQLVVSAPKDLNTYQQQAHTLTVGVIQTPDPNSLYPSLKSADGLVNLLLNQDNKLMLQRIFIQPNEQQTISIDRNAKTQYLILIAGYSDLLPAQSSQTIKIPVEKHSSGFLWLHKEYSAANLYIYADLGPQGIVQVRACDEPLKPTKKCSENLLEKVM